jgi:hypothetical protein
MVTYDVLKSSIMVMIGIVPSAALPNDLDFNNQSNNSSRLGTDLVILKTGRFSCFSGNTFLLLKRFNEYLKD